MSNLKATDSNIKQPENSYGSGLNYGHESNQKESLLQNGPITYSGAKNPLTS